MIHIARSRSCLKSACFYWAHGVILSAEVCARRYANSECCSEECCNPDTSPKQEFVNSKPVLQIPFLLHFVLYIPKFSAPFESVEIVPYLKTIHR
jgi:hypothetical protein